MAGLGYQECAVLGPWCQLSEILLGSVGETSRLKEKANRNLNSHNLDVTVVIAAYNAMPYFRECLQSAVAQSDIKHEIIVIDDGSTDDTGALADEFAGLHPALITVVHQENSGGAAHPRNRGIELANGEFVFFLDADDYLAENALSAMVSQARRAGSDVVLAKMAGVDGRKVPAAMFGSTVDQVDLFSSRVYWTLRPQKLFRRTLITNHGLRFDESLATGEDQPFVARAMIHAQGISVLADQAYYFTRQRTDGGNVTSRVVDAQPRIDLAITMISLVAAEVADVHQRQHLLERHLSVEVMRAIRAVALSEDAQAQQLEPLVAVLTELDQLGMTDNLRAIVRLHYHLLIHRDFDALLGVARYAESRRIELGLLNREWVSLRPEQIDIEDHRCFALYPGWDDPGLPLTLFDVTDELAGVDGLSEALDSAWEFSILAETVSAPSPAPISVSLVTRPVFGLTCESGHDSATVIANHPTWTTMIHMDETSSAVLPLLGSGSWSLPVAPSNSKKQRRFFIRDGRVWSASLRSENGRIIVRAGRFRPWHKPKNKPQTG